MRASEARPESAPGSALVRSMRLSVTASGGGDCESRHALPHEAPFRGIVWVVLSFATFSASARPGRWPAGNSSGHQLHITGPHAAEREERKEHDEPDEHAQAHVGQATPLRQQCVHHKHRVRDVPMTVRLAAALQQHRHLRGSRVLCHDDGRPLAEHVMTDLLAMVGRRANVRSNGPQILRHTFCSHLAMKGARARAIQ